MRQVGGALGLDWRRAGLMVSTFDSRSSDPFSSPGRGHCVVLLDKTLNSHSAPLLYARVNPVMD